MAKEIAIIGAAGRFPEAPTLTDFYKNLKAGKDSVRDVSPQRIYKTTIPDHIRYQPFAYMDDIDLFDYDFFNISFAEAQHMDPAQRILMEAIYETFENAGYDVEHFNGSRTSLFVGDVNLSYGMHVSTFSPTLAIGTSASMTAGRIARYFNLRGCVAMIDTSCSSSLLALHQACNDILLDNADYALACGVNIILLPLTIGDQNSIGIVSSDGKAKAFSAEADGTGSGEACGCVLLKSLDKALRDGDNIHAVIKATAVNHDGSLSASLTAPDSIAQAEVIKMAWRKAGIAPRTVTYVETHGTGTKLGDPIEIKGLTLAFSEFTDDKKFCAVSSVKSNVGHTDSAAGITSVLKAILSLKYKTLFPSLHVKALNPYIDFENTAVYVNTSLKEWAPWESIRRAGISSFGLSGTNCHVVLEEAPLPDLAQRTSGNEFIFTISGRNAGGLRRNAEAMYRYLQNNPAAQLGDVSYTLTAGRKHHAWRLAVVAGTRESLLEQWNVLLSGDVPAVSPSKIIFVFSGMYQYHRNDFEPLCHVFPSFKNDFETCMQYAGPSANSAPCLTFTFQYCFYRLLSSSGIGGKYHVGDGIGKVVIAVLHGKLTLRQAFDTIQTPVVESSDLADRIRKLVEVECGNGTVLFVEAGHEASVSGGLREIGGTPPVTVVSLQEPTYGGYLRYIAALYSRGFPVSWPDFWRGREARRIELPSYQFEKTRCWVDSTALHSVKDWFYRLRWKQQAISATSSYPAGRTYAIFMDRVGLGDAVMQKLSAAGNRCVRIYLTSEFRVLSDLEFNINASEENAFEWLRTTMEDRSISIHGIFNLHSYGPSETITSATVSRFVNDHLSWQVALVKAFHRYFNDFNFLFAAVTANANGLNEFDGLLDPVHGMSVSFLKALMVEYKKSSIHSIDFDFYATTFDEVAYQALQEVFSKQQIRFVTYRKNIRYVQEIRNVSSKELPEQQKTFSGNGVYVITGGLGGIGFEISRMLSMPGNRLIIFGRTEIHSNDDHEGPFIDQKIESLREKLRLLQENGCTVEYHAVDVSDAVAVRAVFEDLDKRVSRISGVIHLAGLGTSGESVLEKGMQRFLDVLLPKVHGTVILEENTRRFNPGFFVCFSSLNAVVPQLNSVDYTIANAFMDSFCCAQAAQGRKFISINWPGWDETGMSVDPDNPGIVASDTAVRRLSTRNGLNGFQIAMELGTPTVVIAEAELSSFLINPFFVVEGENPEAHARQEETYVGRPSTDGNSKLTETERKILGYWFEALKAKEIDIDQDFFDLGGHSLIGMGIVNKIQEEFGVLIEFEELYDHSTVRTLAALIDTLARKEQVAPPAAIYKRSYTDYNATHGQTGLYLKYKFRKKASAFNMIKTMGLKTLNREALGNAVNNLINRHESLRTSFLLVEGKVKQRVYPIDGFPLNIEYVPIPADRDSTEFIGETIDVLVNTPFDLEKAPLLVFKVLVFGDDNFLVILVIDHILCDAWSMENLVKELQVSYEAYCNGKPDNLPPLKIQMGQYAEEQLEMLDRRQAEHLAYWRGVFSKPIEPLNLPVDFDFADERNSIMGYRAVLEQEVLQHYKALTQTEVSLLYGTIFTAAPSRGLAYRTVIHGTRFAGILQLAAQTRCSLFSVLSAALSVYLFRVTGSKDIILGTPVSLRENTNAEALIGWLLDTLLIRIPIDENVSVRTLLKDVSHAIGAALNHRMYPFERVLDEIDLAFPRIGKVFIHLLNFGLSREGQIEDFSALHLPAGMPTFDLNFTFHEYSNGLELVCDYRDTLFKPNTIERMVNGYLMLLDNFDPGKVLSEIKGDLEVPTNADWK